MSPYLAVVVILAVVLIAVMAWPAGGGKLPPAGGGKLPPDPPSKCATVACDYTEVCDPASGQCVPLGTGSCPAGGAPLASQPSSSVQIVNNTSEAPFHVFLEYANMNLVGASQLPALDAPPIPWALISASPGVTLGPPVKYYPPEALPPGVSLPTIAPVAIGSATWQELIMPRRGDTALLGIPDFTPGQPWSVRPLKYHDATHPCGGSEGDCGMPILIESGKNMVGDMSAVDGVNFLLCYQLTTKDGPTTMNFKTNPCVAVGRNRKGCTNPSVNGIFNPGLVGTPACLPADSAHCWLSDPCPAGTCNLTGASKAWCDAVNDGQCANSSSHWSDKQRGSGGPDSCAKYNLFTTYCYSHNDATSSPYFAAPYQIKLVYSDLA